MASSSLSLDSLSSPSPSPSPPPTTSGTKVKQVNSHSTTTAAKVTTAALDSDSELSELTEDDQEGAIPGDKRDKGGSTNSASSAKTVSGTSAHPLSAPARVAANTTESSVDDEDDENDKLSGTASANHSSKSSTTKRGSHQRTLSTTSRRGGVVGRKKRSSIVPAPMWGWAEAKPPTGTSAPAEEEEEEISGPPRAMEEEEEEPPEDEEEDGGREGEFDTSYNNGQDGLGIEDEDEDDEGIVNQRRLGPYVTQRLPGIRSFYRRGRGGAKGGRKQAAATSSRKQVNEEDDDEPVVNGEDVDDASASGSEYNNSSTTRRKKPISTTKGRAGTASAARKRKEGAGHESSASETLATTTARKKSRKGARGRAAAPVGEGEEPVDEEAASEPPIVAVDAGSADDRTDDEDDTTPKKVLVASPKPLSSSKPPLQASKPLSAIGSASTSDPSISALAALAVIADLENPALSEAIGDSGKPSATLSSVAAPAVVETLTLLGIHDPSATTSVDPTPAASTVNSDTEADPPKWKPKGRKTARVARGAKKAAKLALNVKQDGELADGMEVDPDAKDDDKDVEMEGDEPEGDDDDGEDEVEDEEQAPVDDEAAEGEGEDGEEGEGEDEVPEAEGEGEEEAPEAEVENEDEAEKANENEEETIQDADLEDQEIELQPAHRAEALDVLAAIELKFAQLRERLYVEKMENLAWEETMIQASIHPEMQYLQKEMTKRRDKRLELASRKRSYEVANAGNRRRADENGVWSWWKLSVDDLQTDMIAETNRKRRKLERDRRAIERPQPIRRIPPPPPPETVPLHQPPAIRKIIKSFPLDSMRKSASRSRRHQPSRAFIYPEITTLSASDISSDLEFLFQNRRAPSSTFDGVSFGSAPPPLWGQPQGAQRNGLGIGRTMSGLGMGIPNGNISLQGSQPSMMGPPAPPTQGINYEQYAPETSMYAHGSAPNGVAGMSSRPEQGSGPYAGNAGRNRYQIDNEMSIMGSAPTGHQLLPNHPYFGNAGPGPSAMRNGRRSPSPPLMMMSNGAGPPAPRMNGGWMGLPSKSSDRDPRSLDEEMRERRREKDTDRREPWEDERDRARERDSHRLGPPSSSHTPVMDNHLHSTRPHHHHVLHRHGPPQATPHATSSLPSPGSSGPSGALPIVHSPRSGREYDGPRPPPAPTEVIMLSSNKQPQQLPPRERDGPLGPPHPSHPDYRDRDRDIRKSYGRPPSRPSLDVVDDRLERPLATPFTMASSHPMQQNGPPPQLNGSGSLSSSPKTQPGWLNPSSEDLVHRMPPGYPAHGDAHRSPVQGHRYTPNGIPPPPLGRGIPSSTPSSSSLHRMSSPPPLHRARPPPSPSYPGQALTHRSPLTSPKMRAPSPISSKLLGPGRTSTPTGHHPPSTSHTPSGAPPPTSLDSLIKNGSSTPNYPLSSRASPLMSSLHPPSSRPAVNGNSNLPIGPVIPSGLERERERERERILVPSIGSPRLAPGSAVSLPPPPKLSTAPVMESR